MRYEVLKSTTILLGVCPVGSVIMPRSDPGCAGCHVLGDFYLYGGPVVIWNTTCAPFSLLTGIGNPQVPYVTHPLTFTTKQVDVHRTLG
jgi:hypothetical protein